jgi:hypothetical protein
MIQVFYGFRIRNYPYYADRIYSGCAKITPQTHLINYTTFFATYCTGITLNYLAICHLNPCRIYQDMGELVVGIRNRLKRICAFGIAIGCKQNEKLLRN